MHAILGQALDLAYTKKHMEHRPEIVYLPWDRPILTMTVDWLLAEKGGGDNPVGSVNQALSHYRKGNNMPYP